MFRLDGLDECIWELLDSVNERGSDQLGVLQVWFVLDLPSRGGGGLQLLWILRTCFVLFDEEHLERTALARMYKGNCQRCLRWSDDATDFLLQFWCAGTLRIDLALLVLLAALGRFKRWVKLHRTRDGADKNVTGIALLAGIRGQLKTKLDKHRSSFELPGHAGQANIGDTGPYTEKQKYEQEYAAKIAERREESQI